MIYALASAQRLAIARIAILSVCWIDVALDPFARLAVLPRAWFTGHGPWALLPSVVIDALWSHGALLILKLITLAFLSLAIVGVARPRRWALASAVALTMVWGFVRGFGHADHSQLQLLFLTFVLPFLPAWDTYALRADPREERQSNVYIAGFAALAVVFGFPYFLTGGARLAQEGYAIYLGDSMQHFMARDTLALDDFESMFAFSLMGAEVRPLLNLSFLAVTVAELVSPWAYLDRRASAAWLVLVVPFHLLATVLMHVLFVQNLALLIILYLWPLSWRYAWGRAR